MFIRDAQSGDTAAIAVIYNEAVLHSTAIWNEVTVDAANRLNWLRDRESAGFPVLVAVNENGEVSGYASFGAWRAFDGYRFTVENSVYVHPDYRGEGTGKALMLALIERARTLGKHIMVAAIEAENTGSIELHQKLGFEEVGRMPEVGTKFGRWLDLVFLQLRLDSRASPKLGTNGSD